MKFEEKIVDRQVGRNGDLFAATIGLMETREERYPYLRILVSIVEQAHPEWNQAPTKDSQISLLIFRMSKAAIDRDEISEIVQLRDAERGYNFIERKPDQSAPKKDQSPSSEQDQQAPSEEDQQAPSDADQSESSEEDQSPSSEQDQQAPSDEDQSQSSEEDQQPPEKDQS